MKPFTPSVIARLGILATIFILAFGATPLLLDAPSGMITGNVLGLPAEEVVDNAITVTLPESEESEVPKQDQKTTSQPTIESDGSLPGPIALTGIGILGEGDEVVGWNISFSGRAITGTDEIRAVAIDSNDSIFAVGLVHNITGTCLSTTSSCLDWWIKKIKKNGTENVTDWNYTFSSAGTDNVDSAEGVAIDSNDGVYVAGYGFNLTGDCSNKFACADWWIKKFDYNGTENRTHWNINLSRAGATDDNAYGIDIDSGGAVYVVGSGASIAPGSTSADWWIQRYERNGTRNTTDWDLNFTSVVQLDKIDAALDVAVSTAVTSKNAVYVVGYGFNASGTCTGKFASCRDWWIKRFEQNGVDNITHWNLNFTSPGNANDEAKSVAVDSNGSVYVVGFGEVVNGSGSGSDWWVKKFHANGTENITHWNKTFSSFGDYNDIAWDVAIDSEDSVYVVGQAFNLTGLCTNKFSSCDDWLVKKYYRNGTEDSDNWNRNYSSAETDNSDIAYTVAVDSVGNVTVGGSGQALFGSSSTTDWWIKKLDGFNTTPTEAADTCGVLTASKSLTSNVTSDANCFNISAHNIILDCQGYGINYSKASVGYGINNSQGYDNLTVKNCIIEEGSVVSSDKHAVHINNGINTTVHNSTITIVDSSRGINILGTSDASTISGNTITTKSEEAVYIFASQTVNVTLNVINTQGAGVNIDTDGWKHVVAKNNLTCTGTNSCIILQTSRNNVTQNNIITTNTNGDGISLQGDTNIIANNNITTHGRNADAIAISKNRQNYLYNNNLSSKRAYEIRDLSGLDDFGNGIPTNWLVYNNSFGKIEWQYNGSGSFPLNISVNVTNYGGLGLGRNLFIGNNSISVNVSGMQGNINKTVANITFRGLDLVAVDSVQKIHNFTDNESHIVQDGVDCLASGGGCQKISFSSDTNILEINTTSLGSFAGNKSPANIEPVVTLVSPGSGIHNSTGAMVFNCSATDASLNNFTLYGNWSSGWHANETKNINGTSNSTTFSKTILDGVYRWSCLVYDSKGKYAFATPNRTFTVDTTNPTTIIFNPQNTTYRTNTTLNLNYSAVDTNLNTTWYRIDTNANVTITQNVTFNVSEGTHTLYLFANDTVGNQNFSKVVFTVKMAPNITLVSPQKAANLTKLEVELNISLNEVGLIVYNFDNLGNDTLCTSCRDGRKILNLTALGPHNLTIYANDSANNLNVTTYFFNFSLDTDGDGVADRFDTDSDGDGNPEFNDSLRGNRSNINFRNLNRINITINGTHNLSNNFTGVQVVNITNGSHSVVTFEYNFSANQTLVLGNITIIRQNVSASQGSLVVRGINLTYGHTKTLYIDDLDGTKSTICIKDQEIVTIQEVSSACTGANETSVACTEDGSTTDQYTCTDIGLQYKLSGVSNSGAIETTDAEAGGGGSTSTGGGGGSGGGSGGRAVICPENHELVDGVCVEREQEDVIPPPEGEPVPLEEEEEQEEDDAAEEEESSLLNFVGGLANGAAVVASLKEVLVDLSSFWIGFVMLLVVSTLVMAVTLKIRQVKGRVAKPREHWPPEELVQFHEPHSEEGMALAQKLKDITHKIAALRDIESGKVPHEPLPKRSMAFSQRTLRRELQQVQAEIHGYVKKQTAPSRAVQTMNERIAALDDDTPTLARSPIPKKGKSFLQRLLRRELRRVRKEMRQPIILREPEELQKWNDALGSVENQINNLPSAKLQTGKMKTAIQPKREEIDVTQKLVEGLFGPEKPKPKPKPTKQRKQEPKPYSEELADIESKLREL